MIDNGDVKYYYTPAFSNEFYSGKEINVSVSVCLVSGNTFLF